MSGPIIKKSTEILMIITGFILFILSFALLSKPNANQGVAAMPRQYPMSLQSLNDFTAMESGLSPQFVNGLPQSSTNQPTTDSKLSDSSRSNKSSSISLDPDTDGHGLEGMRLKMVSAKHLKDRSAKPAERGTL